KHIGDADLGALLDVIAKEEGVQFEGRELVHELVRQGRGSARDTLSLLDQVLSFCPDRRITEQALTEALGVARSSSLKSITGKLLAGEATALGRELQVLYSENVLPQALATGVLNQLHTLVLELVANPSKPAPVPRAELFWVYETLAKDLVWALSSPNASQALEVVLYKVSLRREFFRQEAPQKEIPKESAPAPAVNTAAPVPPQNTKGWD